LIVTSASGDRAVVSPAFVRGANFGTPHRSGINRGRPNEVITRLS